MYNKEQEARRLEYETEDQRTQHLVHGLSHRDAFAGDRIHVGALRQRPARAYEVKLAQEEEAIISQHDAVGNLQRHVFRYVTYSGEDRQNYYWFNTEGQVITTRAKGTRDDDAARAAAQALGMDAESVTLGYGYENPVYVLQSGDTTLLLDYDTLELVDERELSGDE